MTKRKPNTNCIKCYENFYSKALNIKKAICKKCKTKKEVNCFGCNKLTKNAKFCSRSCSAIETNKTPKRILSKICKKCNKIVRHYRSSFCIFHFRESLKDKKEHIENLSLQDYTERDCVKKCHPSSKFSHIRGLGRSWNKELLKLPCYNCGYNKHVELAHIKAISSFLPTDKIKDINAKTNVIQLCPNCHWEFDRNLITLNI